MRKHYFIKLLFVALTLCLFNQVNAQIIINSEPDSTAVLNQAYDYQVTAIVVGSSPVYSLPTKPAGMTIDAVTGLINWVPVSMTSGGKVVVQATNDVGTVYQTYFVYVAEQLDCDPSVVAYWPMDYMTDNSIVEVAHGYDAFLPDDIQEPRPSQSAEAVAGKSAYFQPTSYRDTAYKVQEIAPFNFTGLDDFSVSLWFKNQPTGFTPVSKEVLVGKYSAAARWALLWNPFTDQLEFYLRENSSHADTLIHATAIGDNNWHHIVISFAGDTATADPSTLKLFIDKNSNTENFDFWKDDFWVETELTLGYWNTDGANWPFSGYLDEVVYYNKVLSYNEVVALYNKGIAGTSICLPKNYAPAIVSDPVTTATEDIAVSYLLKGRDIDGGTLTLSAPVLPAWLAFNATTGLLSGTPTNAEVGVHNVTLRVSDGTYTSDQVFQITVANANDAPTITSTPVTSVNEDALYTYTIVGADVDAGDVLNYSATTIPVWLTFDVNTHILSGTPTNDEVGDHSITLTVTDGTVAVDQPFTLTVVNVNDLPVITTTPEDTAKTDIAYTYVITATDVDEGDVLVYSAVEKPDFLTFTSGANSGTLSGTPAAANVGTYVVQLKVNDGHEDAVQQFTLRVVLTVGLDNIENSILNSTFPNPANETVYFRLASAGKTRVELFDLAGKLQKEISTDNQEIIEMNVSELSKGIYLYKVYQNNKVTIGKIAKE